MLSSSAGFWRKDDGGARNAFAGSSWQEQEDVVDSLEAPSILRKAADWAFHLSQPEDIAIV